MSTLAVLALAVLCQEVVQDVRAPGPPRPIAGMRGFFATTTVVFEEQPDEPHKLHAAYLFPDRARWTLSRKTDRVINYRYGARTFQLPESSRDSIEYRAAERDKVLLRMELRRAAMTWPDGFAWTGAAARRSTPVSSRSDDGARSIGTLRVRLAEDGRPASLAAVRPDGEVQETLEIRSWREDRGRTWPSTMALVVGGKVVWTETLKSVSTRVDFVEDYFLPPDQKELAERRSMVIALLLRAFTGRRTILSADEGWDAALDRAKALIAAAAQAGRNPDPVPTFELHADGRPRSVLVRLKTPVRPAPEGWFTVEDRSGLSLSVPAADGVTPERLTDLLRAVPTGLRAGTPYVRFYERGAARVQIALPLLAAD
ncbi:MAG: hypothetical protein O7B99_06525 [Planctomycetota bacterium]|nr:hypothetical protein [Planctomycetota bacterium]